MFGITKNHQRPCSLTALGYAAVLALLWAAPLFSGQCGSGQCDTRQETISDVVKGAKLTKGPSGTGQITGIVTAYLSGAPLPEATVSIRPAGTNSLESTNTDESGAYTFDGLAAGDYTMIADSDGFIPEIYSQILCTPQSCSLNNGDTVSVVDGETAGANFSLRRPGRIVGTVTDAVSGQAIQGATVAVNSEFSFQSIYGETGADGQFEIESLLGGTYYASARAAYYVGEIYPDVPCLPTCNSQAFGAPIIVNNDDTTVIHFALDLGGQIGGRTVARDTGQPIRAEVDVYDLAGTPIRRARADSKGNFTVSGIPTGDYYAVATARDFVDQLYDDLYCRPRCGVWSGTRLTVNAGEFTPSVDFALDRAGSISGSLMDRETGADLQGVVEVYDGLGVLLARESSTGSYNVEGLPAGDWSVVARSSIYMDQLYADQPCPELNCQFGLGESVTVRSGEDTAGIDFLLDFGGVIEISPVTDTDTGATLSPRFRLWDERGNWLFGYNTSYNGLYQFSGLPNGDYFVGISAPGYVAEVFDDVSCAALFCDVSGGTLVSVTQGAQSQPIQVSLLQGGAISGSVSALNPTEDYVNLRVRAVDESGRFAGGADPNFDTGEFIIHGLPTGRYYLHADSQIHHGQLYPDIPFNFNCPDCEIPIDAQFEVRAGEVTEGVSFELELGGEVVGTVTDSQGRPVPAARILPFDQNDVSLNLFAYNSAPDINGNYRIVGLPTGTHYLMARVPQETGLDTQLYGGKPCLSTCDRLTGTPVAVIAGQTTFDIDFVLQPSEVIAADDFEWR